MDILRKFIVAVLLTLLLLTACKSYSRQNAIEQQEAVKLYLAMNDNVKYSDKVFSGDDAKLFADVVKTECPQGVGDEFVRTSLESTSSTLVIYSDKSGTNITCSLLKPKEQKSIDIRPHSEAADNDTALLVNGKPITIQQVQQQVASQNVNDTATINVIINQLINDELLRQEAEKVDVTDKEIADTRTAVLAQANITEEQLKQNLAAQHLSEEDFAKSVKQQAQLQKLLKKRLLLDEFKITDEDARNFYLNNPNQFLRSEQAVMRTILVASKGRTLDQGRARAQEIAGKLGSTDFCELVKEYSDDAQSKEKCGVYVVPRGVLDSNLELASFNTPVNQTSVVTTNNGIYLVQTLQVVPPQVVPYAQVANTLQQNLRNAVFQQRLNLYIATLRQDATIISYLG